ncbi:9010_t:CDS:1, partial [Gigaspora margarita]
PLRFGGYQMIVYQGDINFGYVLDENGNVSRPQYQNTYVALANNSIVVVENQFGT